MYSYLMSVQVVDLPILRPFVQLLRAREYYYDTKHRLFQGVGVDW